MPGRLNVKRLDLRILPAIRSGHLELRATTKFIWLLGKGIQVPPSQNFSCETGIASTTEPGEVPRRTVSEVASKELSHNLLFCEF